MALTPQYKCTKCKYNSFYVFGPDFNQNLAMRCPNANTQWCLMMRESLISLPELGQLSHDVLDLLSGLPLRLRLGDHPAKERCQALTTRQ